MAQGWSSLPADLVNRVADCLLATNDLDCYTDLRAVCHHWRFVTADPGSNQHDPRFRPTRWVMLDEHEVSSAVNTYGPFVFVNTATGRFLRRRLQLLPDRDSDRDIDYLFVTSTTGGLIVLAARKPPHAVSVLNLFTGSLIRFAAPLPGESGLWLRFTADVVGSSPTLVLVAVGCSLVYWAEPQSESFSVEMRHRSRMYPASRLPLIAAAVNRKPVPAAGAKNIFVQLFRS